MEQNDFNNKRRGRVVSITLPTHLYEFVKETVGDKHFKSTSEFFRYLLHLYREKIIGKRRDLSSQERLEEGQYRLKKHFEDIKHLSQLIANSIETTKEAGEFEDD
jgi:Arc/MetJ-type ribon-helix-helix transcriptional regulator